MKVITEEMNEQKEWYKEAQQMTVEKLSEFINSLTNDYHHDYGTICHAMAASAIAAVISIDNSPQGGITGFQAGCIMWEFIRNWMYSHNKCGLRLIDYDDMLYPQYEEKFAKTIDNETWFSLQEEAKRQLKSEHSVHPAVKAHWQSIVNGVVPFGYKVKEDN